MRLVMVCVVLLVFSAPVRAQFETASVVGTLRDSSGGTVADGVVTLLNTETGVSVTRTSGAEGHYEFITVRPGTHVVTGEKPGFAIVLVDGVIFRSVHGSAWTWRWPSVS